MKDSREVLVRVKKSDTHIIITFLEGYEHCAAVRTPNPEPGEFSVLQLMVSPDYMGEIKSALNALKKKGLKFAVLSS